MKHLVWFEILRLRRMREIWFIAFLPILLLGWILAVMGWANSDRLSPLGLPMLSQLAIVGWMLSMMVARSPDDGYLLARAPGKLRLLAARTLTLTALCAAIIAPVVVAGIVSGEVSSRTFIDVARDDVPNPPAVGLELTDKGLQSLKWDASYLEVRAPWMRGRELAVAFLILLLGAIAYQVHGPRRTPAGWLGGVSLLAMLPFLLPILMPSETRGAFVHIHFLGIAAALLTLIAIYLGIAARRWRADVL